MADRELNGVLGLDYASVRTVADALGLAWTADLLDRLQVMESAVLAALARK